MGSFEAQLVALERLANRRQNSYAAGRGQVLAVLSQHRIIVFSHELEQNSTCSRRLAE